MAPGEGASQPTVFVSRKLPDAAMELLQRISGPEKIEVWPEDLPPSPRDLARGLVHARGLLCLLTDRIDATLLDSAPELHAISQMAVGYDNIDVAECTRRGIAVGNTPGVLADTTADLAFGLLLAAARRLPQAERSLRAGEWRTWSPLQFTGADVYSRTLGIIGMGQIGRGMARRAKGFGMRILYTGPRPVKPAEQETRAAYVSLETLLQESDFVSLHAPLNPQTRGLIGAAQIGLMKSSAFLINTSRGALLDEHALAEALSSGRLAGAGLDVYEHEPLPPDNPLLKLDNVVLLPHIGSAS
ncbi:MAG TPA: D-glycerate dehydrogenase, partial [Chthonomonadales bacterium]|nr:D-glycerate dehydrogenase [Chthonomonadales bacterium]